jgi:hypothetical protein
LLKSSKHESKVTNSALEERLHQVEDDDNWSPAGRCREVLRVQQSVVVAHSLVPRHPVHHWAVAAADGSVQLPYTRCHRCIYSGDGAAAAAS